MSNQKTIFVILSAAKNLSFKAAEKPPRFVTKRRSVQNDIRKILHNSLRLSEYQLD